jgi:hypothetical protein
MSRLIAFIPDEWVSAARAFADMWRVSGKTSHGRVKTVLGLAIPFSVGVLISLRCSVHVSSDFIQGFLAVVGVLFGFVVTLMLFTGSLDGTRILSHQQARRYADKIMYLLFSQTLTLTCFLFAILSASTWLFLNKGGSAKDAYLVPFLYGSSAIALVRTILLPAQIYECHHFVLETMVEEKLLSENQVVEHEEAELERLRRRRD